MTESSDILIAGLAPSGGGGSSDLDAGTTTKTAGSVLFSDGSKLEQDNANLYYDDANNRLGVGTATPTHTLEVDGTTHMTGIVKFRKGADIASATGVTLGTDGNYFDVTGTTTIETLSTTGKNGTVIKLHFDGILTLTHGASGIWLPGAANITTAAGDEAEFVEYTAGIYRCTNYTKVDGTAVVSAGGGISNVVEDTTPQLGGDLDCNGAQIQWSQGADVASGAALPVLTDGNYFDVTGTTTVTSINTTGGAGTQIKLHFDGAVLLTHHATNLILPGGANITTAAGDEAEFIEYGAGTYRCTNYAAATGKAVVETASIANVVEDTTPQLGAALDTNSFAINESEGAAVASATTTDIFGGDDGNTLHITGTTTVTDFTDASSVGQWRKIIFDGILTLTHGSGITLPGSSNITTAAGDYAFVYADTVSAFTVLYFKADGTAVVSAGGGGAYNLIETQTASASSSIDFTTSIDSTYTHYQIVITDYRPDTSSDLHLLVSDDGGSTFETGATYKYHTPDADVTASGYSALNATAGTFIDIMGGAIPNASDTGGIIIIDIPNPSNTATNFYCSWTVCQESTAPGPKGGSGVASFDVVAAYDGIRLIPSASTITSGTFKLYGIS